MNTVKQEEKYFNTEEIKESVGLSESAFRKILSEYKRYIPHRKGLKNSNLFPWGSVQMIKSVKNMKQHKYEHSEIVHNLRTHPSYLRSKLQSGEEQSKQEVFDLMNQPDVRSLVDEFVSRIKKQESEIRSLSKTLDKRTKNYQEEIAKYKEEQTNNQKDIEYLNEKIKRINDDLEMMVKEQEKSLFKKFISFLKQPVF